LTRLYGVIGNIQVSKRQFFVRNIFFLIRLKLIRRLSRRRILRSLRFRFGVAGTPEVEIFADNNLIVIRSAVLPEVVLLDVTADLYEASLCEVLHDELGITPPCFAVEEIRDVLVPLARDPEMRDRFSGLRLIKPRVFGEPSANSNHIQIHIKIPFILIIRFTDVVLVEHSPAVFDGCMIFDHVPHLEILLEFVCRRPTLMHCLPSEAVA